MSHRRGAIWKTMTWDYSGVTARKCRRGFGYDIADIHRRLAVCRDEAEYRLQMEEMNRAYFDPSFRFAPNASLHCRGNENNPFWGWFRVDIAAIASGRYAVIWPLPEALANRVWGISPK